MAKCPICGKEVYTPSKFLKNHYFTIEAYSCDECNNDFKITSSF